MKVLVTGATGLVGKAITQALHNQGISVNYLTTRKGKIVSSEDYQGFYWNPSKGEIDLNCFEDVSAVINLAGSNIAKRWTSSYKKQVLNSRLNSLKTLRKGIEQIGDSDIISFVSASAIGIYPNSLTTFYEETETSVDDSFLGEVVHEWEKEIDTFKKFDFNVAEIRIGLVLSTEGGALPKIARPVNYYVGAAFGSGEQWQSWIHIDDLAQMFLFVIAKGLQGTFNGVAPNPVTNTKLTKEIAKVLKRPLILPNIPKFVMYALLGEMAYVLFASQRVSSKRIEEKGFVFQHTNVCAALEELLLPDSPNNDSKIDSFSKEYV
ncbi:TIGR01777 family oxidoreductase [Flagellimonas allohymeniacidonis]|uniref:TIGR01777 family protein n=1 Tax=Flagellimonas allohymeniacidonis TaxID=2517819 RepID=A0A4Q8QFZ5_9FLAO|nr:TIGR01777 family oxidoreductase [Allomuricauda hymeniacidonis]TAI49445.1 TIGR01777 family protein [Allomuricauda hymeniacidonis]